MSQYQERISEAASGFSYGAGKLIGLEAVCAEIEQICASAPVYRHFGLKPEHLLVYLDSGNGRTAVTEYAADRFLAEGVLDFTSGLDDFITIKLDGTLSQYKRAVQKIRDAAVYQNHYTGIVEADVMELAAHQNETQYCRFFMEFPEICRHAYFIFFAPAIPTKNEEKFLDKLISGMGNIKCLMPEAYGAEELSEIAMNWILERGCVIEDSLQIYSVLCSMIEHLGIREVKGALGLAADVVRGADYSVRIPRISKS